MKINDVRCVEYFGALTSDEPFWRERLRRPVDVYPEFAGRGPRQLRDLHDGTLEVRQIFLHVDTDEGLTGTTAVLSREQLRRAHHVAAAGARRRRARRRAHFGRLLPVDHPRPRGTGMFALSAIDCALWDLRGQFFGVPVHVLLGGPARTDAPASASILGDSLAPDDVTARTHELRAVGFGGLKWLPRSGPNDGREGWIRSFELVAAVRDAGGDDLEIMLDAWWSWDVPFTVAVARDRGLSAAVDEEPLLADDTGGYRALRGRGRTRSSAAGTNTPVGGSHRFCASGGLDLYQPDPHWDGGYQRTDEKISALISAAGGQLDPARTVAAVQRRPDLRRLSRADTTDGISAPARPGPTSTSWPRPSRRWTDTSKRLPSQGSGWV